MRWIVRVAALSLVALLPTAALARPDPLPPPGSYEAQALDLALARAGLTLEPHPEGKIVGAIHVVNLEVFGPRDGWLLRWFNHFHRTTRPDHIEREVILRPGQRWDQSKLDETARKLRDPIFTTAVVLAPVENPTPGRVDLLVVTRDVWSLRFNSTWEIQERQLTELSLSISENNLLGWRKHLALVFSMDQGKYFIGPYYHDPNLAGTRLQLVSYAGAIYGRKDNQAEGSWSRTSVEYPLWSLASRWGARYQVAHYDSITRVFQGADLRQFDDPATPEREHLPWEYRKRTLEFESSMVYSIGTAILHRFTGGYRLGYYRPNLTDDFGGDQATRDAFTAHVLPRSERSSGPFVGYRLFTPRYVTYRDIDTYDLSEDAQLGPDLKAELSLAPEAFGSEYGHLGLKADASYTGDLADDGMYRIRGQAEGRLQDGDLIDNLLQARIDLATPRQWDAFRLVARVAVAARLDEAQNRFLTLGGRTGLRGYPIGEFIGQRSAVVNVEIRSMPTRLWFSRIGGLLFWDAGGTADRMDDLGLHHDLGVGLRMLIPQLAPLVYRFDWAFALDGRSSGWPGRFTAGVAQAF